MRITNQMLVNQLKKIHGKSTAGSQNSEGLKVGTAFTAKVANVFDGLLTLEIAPRTYVEAQDTTGAQYQEGEVLEFVVTEHDSNGKVFIKAVSPEVMEMLENKELQQVIQQTGIQPTKENMDIIKQLMLNQLPVSEENVKLISQTKAHFENVVNLAESKDLELTESKLVDDVKKVLIEQYKSEIPIKNESHVKPDSSVKQLANNNVVSTSKEQTTQVVSKGVESTQVSETKPIPVEVNQEAMKKVTLPNSQVVDTKVTSDHHNDSNVVNEQSKEHVATDIEDKSSLIAKTDIEDKSNLITKANNEVLQNEVKTLPLSEEAVKELATIIKELTPEKLVFAFKNSMSFSLGNIKQLENLIIGKHQLADQVLTLVDQIEQSDPKAPAVKELLSTLNRFEFDDFADKDKVNEQLRILGETLARAVESSGLKGQSEAVKDQFTNLKQSVDFMNNLNDQMTYLQIPMMLDQKTNTIEMFVQREKSGKKKINPKDTKVFISLDTNHLKRVQVLIEVKDNRIDLNFRLEDDDVEQLIRRNESGLVQAMERVGFDVVYFQYATQEERMDLTNMIRLESDQTLNKIDVRV